MRASDGGCIRTNCGRPPRLAAVGQGATALRVGGSIATADEFGAYAEYCVASADVVAPVPDSEISDAAAPAPT